MRCPPHPLALPAAALALVSAWSFFANADGLGIDSGGLHLEGVAGSIHRIERSTDLQTWLPVLTLELPASGMVDLADDTGVDEPRRFFRSVPLEPGSLTGDHLLTEAGDVLIHSVDHASFVMQWDGKTIYNDPVGGAAAFTGIPQADLILVGHRHGDHFSSSTLSAILKAETVIIAPQDVFDRMSAALKAQTTVVDNDADIDVLGLNIAAIPAYNSNHPRGEGNGYVVTIGGKRIYMSGDTGATDEMRALVGIDVAFVAMNLPFTMSVDDAASVIRGFQPKVIYPYHYRNSTGTFADFNRLAELLGTDIEIELRLRNWY